MHDLVNSQKLPLPLYGIKNDGPNRARHVYDVCVRSADYGLASVSRRGVSGQIQYCMHCVADVDGLTRYECQL